MQTLTPHDYQAVASQLKALSCAARLHIVELLLKDAGKINVDHLVQATGLSQGVVSNHIRKLLKAGLVEPGQQRGHYIALPERIHAVMEEAEMVLGCGEAQAEGAGPE